MHSIGRRLSLIACLFILALPLGAHAAPSAERWIQRCPAPSPVQTSAWDAFNDFAAHLEDTARTATPEETRRRFQTLLAHPCFEMAAHEASVLPSVDSVWGFRTWWLEGGRAWLTSYLAYSPEHVYASEGPPRLADWTIIPPTERRVLTRESTPKHRLLPLLCPHADPHCGLIVDSWRIRADAALWGLKPPAPDLSASWSLGEPAPSDALTRCTAATAALPATERYRAWRACIDGLGPRGAQVPLGRFRVPSDGWLVVVDSRRPNDAGCVRTRLYDVNSGTTYRYAACDCGEAMFPHCLRDSEVSAKERIFAGRVPVAALREALWMLAVVPHTRSGALTRAHKHYLPAGMQPRWVESNEMPARWGGGFGAGGGSHTLHLHWAWLREGAVLLSGHLEQHHYIAPAERYAVTLLDLVDNSRSAACPEAALPAFVDRAPAMRAQPGFLRTFMAAVQSWNAQPACETSSRSP